MPLEWEALCVSLGGTRKSALGCDGCQIEGDGSRRSRSGKMMRPDHLTSLGLIVRKSTGEYRRFAADCRELASRVTREDDKYALELMAQAWEKVAISLRAKKQQEQTKPRAANK
jgi:hypothetical protein